MHSLRFPLLRLLLVFALVGAGHTTAHAAPQAETEAAAIADSDGNAEAAPAPIAVADIASRISDDERFAEDVILRARDSDAIVRLTPRLAAIERSASAKAKLFRRDELMRLPVLRLESLERHWAFDARQFAYWQLDLKTATTQYTEDAGEIARRRGDWIATRAQAAKGNLPTALSGRIDAMIAQLDQAERALSVPLLKQIELGRRANRLDASIRAGQKGVTAAIDHIDSRLVRMDAPPLWALGRDAGEDAQPLSAIGTGLGIELEFLKQYGSADIGNQRALHILQWLLLAVLLWLALLARRGRLPTAAHPDYGQVLRRPLSSWVLLAMMGVLAFEPNAPLLVHQIAMLAALIPVLRMLPPRTRERFGAWPMIATAFYLLERLGFLFTANALIYRSYLLGLALCSMALILWMLHRARAHRRTTPATTTDRMLHGIAVVSVALLATAAASNLFGNVSLAETLASGIIDSAYMALALHASVNVAAALVHACLHFAGRAGIRIIGDSSEALSRSIARGLGVAAALGWVIFALQRFRIWRPLYALAKDVLQHPFAFGELSITLGNVLVFVIAVAVALLSARTVRSLLRHEVLPKMSLPRGVDNSIASLSYYAMLMLGLLLALSAAGFKVGQLAFVFGALGVGIGLGLQDVVKNFVSGLILMFERPIQPGDVIDIGGTNGRVRQIGMRSTTVTTFEGADVVVPNGMLLSEKLTNWTLLDRRRRLEVPVGVAYGSDVPKVMALLQAATVATPGVAPTPAPAVLFSGMGGSALEFSVRAWTHDYDEWVLVRSALVTRLHAALVDAGIDIPYPQQDIHLRSVPDGWPAAPHEPERDAPA